MPDNRVSDHLDPEPIEQRGGNVLKLGQEDGDIKRELLAGLDAARKAAEEIGRPAGLILVYDPERKAAAIHGGGAPLDYLTMLRFLHRTLPGMMNECVEKIRAVQGETEAREP